MGEKIKNSILFKEIKIEVIIRFLLYFILTIYPFILLPEGAPIYIPNRLMLLFDISIILIGLILLDRKIKLYSVNIISLIFLFTLFIASIFSRYKEIAFWGTISSNEGFFVICTYILLFIVSTNYFKINKKSFNLILIAPTIMCMYGILQFYGYDPIQKIILGEIVTNSTIGLIGHRNFFSTYIILFLSVYLSYYIFNGGKKYFICSSIMFAALLCTTTRSGWVSFAIMIFMGLIFILKRKDCLKRASIVFVVFTSIFITLNYTSSGAIFNRASIIIDEANGVTNAIINKDIDISDRYGSSRIFIWKMAMRAFLDKPLLGEGPDTLKSRLMEDYNEKYMGYAKCGDYFEKSHNEILEYAVSGGIFTAISFCILIICIIFGVLKNIKNDKFKVLFLMIISYISQSMFNISVIMVAPIVWILLGVCVRAYKEGVDSIIKI